MTTSNFIYLDKRNKFLNIQISSFYFLISVLCKWHKRNYSYLHRNVISQYKGYDTDYYKACPSESGTEVGAPLFPAVELCDFHGRWQCMSGEIWYKLDSGSVSTEAEAR